jgi:hypothetical protein
MTSTICASSNAPEPAISGMNDEIPVEQHLGFQG